MNFAMSFLLNLMLQNGRLQDVKRRKLCDIIKTKTQHGGYVFIANLYKQYCFIRYSSQEL